MAKLTKSQIEDRRISLVNTMNELVYLDPRSEVERKQAIKYIIRLSEQTQDFDLYENAPQSFIELCWSRYTAATDKFSN